MSRRWLGQQVKDSELRPLGQNIPIPMQFDTVKPTETT